MHARRQFYELPNGYDDLAETVIRLIGKIYDYEADTKGLDAQSRLEYHQENSTPIMAELKEYLEEQQDQFEPQWRCRRSYCLHPQPFHGIITVFAASQCTLG